MEIVEPEDAELVVAATVVVVFDVTGAEDLAARLASITFNALSSCPIPVVPSNLVVVHLDPQAVPLVPPEHEAAAPDADF